MSTTGNQITTHLPNIDATQPYHRVLEDESQGCDTNATTGPFPGKTAGITNTSNSVGIDPSHNTFFIMVKALLCIPLSIFGKQLTAEASVIYATRSQQDALACP